jgi:stearoyl-CoA desaturase (delta-9 desaturase)
MRPTRLPAPTTSDGSRNNLLIGFLAAGEGWHNNHHADPTSARHGHQWWEFDLNHQAVDVVGSRDQSRPRLR